MMTDRSNTLHRMVATELRNVARYGAARRERLDAVLQEIANSKDIEGVLLERDDGAVRFLHGTVPQVAERQGQFTLGKTLVVTGPVSIETLGCLELPNEDKTAASACPHEHDAPSDDPSNELPSCCAADSSSGHVGCSGGPSTGLDGTYRVTLAIDATPYLRIRRSVIYQATAGGLVLLALALALGRHQRQMRRHAQVTQALAIADERARYLERLSLVAGGLAHEIKNPIGALRGFAQLIGEKMEAGSAEAEYVSLMVSELDSITRRVDGLRQFARPAPIQLQSAYPTEIVQRIAALLAPDIASRKLSMHLDLPPSPGPKGMIDADRLRDLIVNLMTNAIEASPEGGTVYVRFMLDQDTQTFLFEVQDEGPGIPVSEREGVLRPFHSTKPDGLGLGLALAQRAVEDHRGTLEIDSSSHGGTAVRARWPRSATREG
ncbi:MAG TPA: ATP-binding protein [Polyangiaceae bacterium]|nr:ATP-binding protein [Polyangiaceae bacterium]